MQHRLGRFATPHQAMLRRSFSAVPEPPSRPIRRATGAAGGPPLRTIGAFLVAVAVVALAGCGAAGQSEGTAYPASSSLEPADSSTETAPAPAPSATPTIYSDPRAAACPEASARPLPSVHAGADDTPPTTAGGHWTAGGGTAIVGDIVVTPKAYLANVALAEPQSGASSDDWARSVLCVSTDLIHWQAPNPELFVNETGVPFHAYRQIAVRQGYAVITAESCNWGGGWPCPENGWYSKDGVHWHAEIPGEVKYDPHCVTLDGCMHYLWTPKLELMLQPSRDGPTLVSTDAQATWVKSNLPAYFEVDQLVRTGDGLFVVLGGQFGPPPPPSMVVGGNPSVAMYTSRDGITWSEAQLPPGSSEPKIVVLGSKLMIATLDEDYIGYLWASLDHGGRWIQMVDSTGRKLHAERIQAAGDRIVVFSLGRTIAWVGTPD
jgi:hypothetical protein